MYSPEPVSTLKVVSIFTLRLSVRSRGSFRYLVLPRCFLRAVLASEASEVNRGAGRIFVEFAIFTSAKDTTLFEPAMLSSGRFKDGNPSKVGKLIMIK